MIRTTTVGSWPIPFGLKPTLTRYYRGALSDETAHDVLQAAARIAMDEQRACGLDQIMGGEVFAPDFVHHVPARLTGLEVVQRRERHRRFRCRGQPRHRAADDVLFVFRGHAVGRCTDAGAELARPVRHVRRQILGVIGKRRPRSGYRG